MSHPRSHPSFRKRGTLTQAQYEDEERASDERRAQEAREKFPERIKEAEERSARWLEDLK